MLRDSWLALGSSERWFIALAPPLVTSAAGALAPGLGAGTLWTASGMLALVLSLAFGLGALWRRAKVRLKERSGSLSLPGRAASAALRPDGRAPKVTWKAAWLAAIRRSSLNKPHWPYAVGALSAIAHCVVGLVGLVAEADGAFGLTLGAGLGQGLVLAGFLRPPEAPPAPR